MAQDNNEACMGQTLWADKISQMDLPQSRLKAISHIPNNGRYQAERSKQMYKFTANNITQWLYDEGVC